MMKDYKRYILLLTILVISGFYCFYFFNGYLGLSDGNDYAGLARSILRGEGFSLGHLYPLAFSFNDSIPQPNNLWAPVYPLYLVFWFLIFGMSDQTILVATVFSVWLYIFAVYMVARKIVGGNWAILGAALAGLSQSALAIALEGSPEPLTAALFLFSVYLLIGRTTGVRLCVSGVFFGLAVLSRYQMVILSIAILFFLTDKKLRSILLWSGVTFLTISPWLIRNYIVLGNPFFTLQAYGEFTKGMGHLDYYYYTYRSFTPMTFFYALTNFPFYVLKKFLAGNLFFCWWTVVVLNFLGAIPFALAIIRRKHFNSVQKRFIGFSIASLILLIELSALNGIHLRHLVNIQGALIITLILGFVYLKEQLTFLRGRFAMMAAVIILLLPTRFPFLEIEHRVNADNIEKNKKVYDIIKEETPQDAVIISDASDGIWWYGDRLSIWIPVLYSDLKTLLEIRKADFIYFENTSDYLSLFKDDELVDFLSNTSIVEGDPFGWSLYRINED